MNNTEYRNGYVGLHTEFGPSFYAISGIVLNISAFEEVSFSEDISDTCMIFLH